MSERVSRRLSLAKWSAFLVSVGLIYYVAVVIVVMRFPVADYTANLVSEVAWIGAITLWPLIAVILAAQAVRRLPDLHSMTRFDCVHGGVARAVWPKEDALRNAMAALLGLGASLAGLTAVADGLAMLGTISLACLAVGGIYGMTQTYRSLDRACERACSALTPRD